MTMPTTTKRPWGLICAWAVWLALSSLGLRQAYHLPQQAVPLHHWRVEQPAVPDVEPPSIPALAPAQPPEAAPSPPAPAVIPVPQDASVSAALCAPWLQRWPALQRHACEQARLAPSPAQSVRGLPLAWRDVASAPATPLSDVVRVLIIGAIHGDELTAAALALDWIQQAERSQRPVHWRFIPVLNPDGLLARPATRTNANGVDLNRNFATPDWERDAALYWEKRTRRDPRRWPGPAPLSEPETRFIDAQMQDFAPDLVVSIHAPYGVLDFDGPHTPPHKLGQLYLDQLGVFPGSLGNFGGVHLGVPVVTIELHHALRMPARREMDAMWHDLLAWMDKHLNTQK